MIEHIIKELPILEARTNDLSSNTTKEYYVDADIELQDGKVLNVEGKLNCSVKIYPATLHQPEEYDEVIDWIDQPSFVLFDKEGDEIELSEEDKELLTKEVKEDIFVKW